MTERMYSESALRYLIENWRAREDEHRKTALAQKSADEARGHAAFAAAYGNCATELEAILQYHSTPKETNR